MNLRLARLYEQQREYSKVEAVYLEVLKENPTNLIALNNLAYAYIDQLDRPEDGLKLIEQAIKAVPGDPNLVDTYAWALARMGRIDEALPIFQQIITRASSSPDSLYHMGYVLEQSGDLTEARSYYRRALEILKTKQNHSLQTKVQTALSRMEQTLSKE